MTITTRQWQSVLGAALALLVAGSASAQSTPKYIDWRHGTTLNLIAGVNSSASHSGVLGGGAFGWEVTPRFAIEGTGSWLDRGRGASAYAADLKALLGTSGPRTVVPFVTAGIGLYRASFDRARGDVPDFYSRRLAPNREGFTAAVFTDPSFIAGGGVNLFVSPRVSIRPEVEMKVIRRDSHSYVATVVAMRVAYHFEDHPITPARH